MYVLVLQVYCRPSALHRPVCLHDPGNLYSVCCCGSNCHSQLCVCIIFRVGVPGSVKVHPLLLVALHLLSWSFASGLISSLLDGQSMFVLLFLYLVSSETPIVVSSLLSSDTGFPTFS